MICGFFCLNCQYACEPKTKFSFTTLKMVDGVQWYVTYKEVRGFRLSYEGVIWLP